MIGMYKVQLAHKYGLNASVLLGAIFYRLSTAKANGELDEDGYIAITAEQLYEWTSLTRRQQNRVVNLLMEGGYIDCKIKGIPAKKCFKVLKMEE